MIHKIEKYNYNNLLKGHALQEVIDFLHLHLEEYGDTKKDISNAIIYALSQEKGQGGHVYIALNNDQKIISAAVVNHTGMMGYIPENILVYIATHKNYRGKGIGRTLLKHAIETEDGAMALHCEPDNPARKLYESLGFASKYLEMRLKS